jgi:hypothetical protein
LWIVSWLGPSLRDSSWSRPCFLRPVRAGLDAGSLKRESILRTPLGLVNN